MPTGREVVETIKEAFELFSEMELPLKEREVTIMYEAALPLIGYIERLESAQPKWISVEERLPTPDTYVLVLTAPGTLSVGQNCVVADYIHPKGEKHGAFINFYAGYKDENMLNVTRWMPLPPGPEE